MALIYTALTLNDLPLPPPDKSGWPWTEQSETFTKWMPDNSEWPRISIVTPSYNQGQFIEETIRSVLLQGYPNLEYIIIDGGSTDNSVEIIKKYEKYLAYWVSEPDRGQSHALNKGFCRATGHLIGWQNSDDYYHSEAFVKAAKASVCFKDIDIIYGLTKNVDQYGNFVGDYPVSSFNIEEMMPYLNMCNQSMFFNKKIFENNNFINEDFQHAMDLEFLLRLALKNYKFYLHSDIIGYYRVHENAKSFKQYNICADECLIIYSSVYKNTALNNNLRNKAISCIHGLCLDSFRVFKLDIFYKSLKMLISLSGLKHIDSKITCKYLLSFLGTQNLQRIKKIKIS
jgi:glycosyltransferase involved in cell wall biosynthesis